MALRWNLLKSPSQDNSEFYCSRFIFCFDDEGVRTIILFFFSTFLCSVFSWTFFILPISHRKRENIAPFIHICCIRIVVLSSRRFVSFKDSVFVSFISFFVIVCTEEEKRNKNDYIPFGVDSVATVVVFKASKRWMERESAREPIHWQVRIN